MDVSELPISEQTRSLLKDMGVHDLYPTQVDAIKHGVLEGKNLVLSTPTASGKTLVALLVMVERLLGIGGKAIYLVPLRALASEKYSEFEPIQKIVLNEHRKARVTMSTGDYDSSASELTPYDIIIATYEKMDSILRHLPKWLSNVRTIIFDEIHLLGETKRGPTLEMLVTWMKRLLPNSQILAMSATVPNGREIADWLGAELVSTSWRPVPLLEGVCLDNAIVFEGGRGVELEDTYADPIMNLAEYSIRDGGQGLFFTPSRKSAVATARKLKPVSWLILTESEKAALQTLSKKIVQVSEETRLSRDLADCARFGVAFHHAGLAHVHRTLIEDYYRKGTLKILTATPTLAAGVNLPSRIVCPTSLYRYHPGIGSVEITVGEYKQMAGRAGRPQYDDHGEAILISSDQGQSEYLTERYIRGEMEPIKSRMEESMYLGSAVLATAAARIASDVREMEHVFQGTLLSFGMERERLSEKVRKKLHFLCEGGALEIDDEKIFVTRLGGRISELYIMPETAFKIGVLLRERPRRFTQLSVLHMICLTHDMPTLIYSSRREGELVESFIFERGEELYLAQETEMLLDQTKTTMVLHMWADEVSEDNILSTLNVEPGDVHTVVESAQWLLYSSMELARIFGYGDAIRLIDTVRERIRHGVKEELLDLVRIRGVGRVRARRLQRAGYTSVKDLAQASATDLSKIPGIGTKLALSIKEYAGGLIRKKELRSPEDFQTSIRDFSQTGDEPPRR